MFFSSICDLLRRNCLKALSVVCLLPQIHSILFWLITKMPPHSGHLQKTGQYITEDVCVCVFCRKGCIPL